MADWFLILVFAGGTADLVPVPAGHDKCMLAANSVTATPTPKPWRKIVGKRKFLFASCLPCPLVLAMHPNESAGIECQDEKKAPGEIAKGSKIG